jgi:Na+-driven multidrug efflux pump
MRFLKITLFMIAFAAVWYFALGVAAGMGNGAPSDMAMGVATVIVLIPFLWLGRRLFRKSGRDRVMDVEQAAMAVTAVAVSHTMPAIADDMAGSGDVGADVDVD